jgi:hypothetical protein
MSGSCRGQETGEGSGIWREKGLEVHTAHDPVLHMIVLMWVAHEHNSLPTPLKGCLRRAHVRPSLRGVDASLNTGFTVSGDHNPINLPSRV